MLALELLDLPGPRFPPLPPLKELARQPIHDHAGSVYCEELRRLALAKGRLDVARALAKPLRRYRLRQMARQVDADLFGGRLRRLTQRGS
jgi:hypothetical protein